MNSSLAASSSDTLLVTMMSNIVAKHCNAVSVGIGASCSFVIVCKGVNSDTYLNSPYTVKLQAACSLPVNGKYLCSIARSTSKPNI